MNNNERDKLEDDLVSQMVDSVDFDTLINDYEQRMREYLRDCNDSVLIEEAKLYGLNVTKYVLDKEVKDFVKEGE